jgi:hypothetical protein
VNSCFLYELDRYIRTYIVWKTPLNIRTILTIASNISGHTCTIIVIEQIRTCAAVQARDRYTFVSFWKVNMEQSQRFIHKKIKGEADAPH